MLKNSLSLPSVAPISRAVNETNVQNGAPHAIAVNFTYFINKLKLFNYVNSLKPKSEFYNRLFSKGGKCLYCAIQRLLTIVNRAHDFFTPPRKRIEPHCPHWLTFEKIYSNV